MNLVKKDWYNNLITDCEAIIGETIYIARDIVIKGKWMLGERIEQERFLGYDEIPISEIGKDLNISKTELYNCIQFYKKYKDLENFLKGVEEQKNISWNKIVHKYLIDSQRKEEEKIPCPTCGKMMRKT